MLKLHESLLSLDSQKGRRLLYEYAELGPDWKETLAEPSNTEDRDQINRSLSQFDVLGYYVLKGYVRKEDALDLWGITLLRCWDTGRPYLDARRQRPGNAALWPYYENIARQAAQGYLPVRRRLAGYLGLTGL